MLCETTSSRPLTARLGVGLGRDSPAWAGISTTQPSSGCVRRTPRCRPARRSGWPRTRPTCSGPGSRAEQPGLDVSGLDRRDRDRPGRADRRRAGHVHLRAPRRRHAAARADPAGRAAAAHDHPRRRGHRARHRVDQLPQRAPARVGPRDGHPHRRRRGRHHPARRRPLRRVPQLLRLAGLRDPAADRLEEVPRPRRAAAPALRRRRAAGQDRRGDRRDRRVRGRPGRRARRRRVRAGRALPHPGPLGRDAGRRHATPPATTPASRSTTGRSSSARPTC